LLILKRTSGKQPTTRNRPPGAASA